MRQAFKDEVGRDATPAELEDFKKQASEPEAQMPTEEELKAAFKEETGKDPTPDELEDFKRQASEPEQV